MGRSGARGTGAGYQGIPQMKLTPVVHNVMGIMTVVLVPLSPDRFVFLSPDERGVRGAHPRIRDVRLQGGSVLLVCPQVESG